MSRKQVSLLLILIAGVMLWLTQGWWLSWVLGQLPRVEQQADLIQSLGTIVSLVVLAFNGIIGYSLWLTRSDGNRPAQELEDPVVAVRVEALRRGLGPYGGQVEWVDRQATRVGDLWAYGRMVIIGRRKLGKTREAIELIRRAVAEELILAERIYEPRPAVMGLLGEQGLRERLSPILNQHLPALLFIDDLPDRFNEPALELLSQTLTLLRGTKALYIVATGRSDQLNETTRGWIERHQFHVCSLPDLDQAQTGAFVDQARRTFDFRLDAVPRQICDQPGWYA